VHQVSKILARVKMIMNVLNQQWPVLATMTPNEFNAFRPALGSSSGFQSAGYRAIEFLLGNKSHAMVSYHQHSQEATDQLKEILDKPSLYDEFLAYLGRQGLRIPEEVLRRDVTVSWTSHPDVVEAARQVYADKEKYWGAYELAEKLVDLDESVSMWRFRHLTTVSRTIGFKSGTGGSSGVGFLNEFVSRRFFPELWEVRTAPV
jgi:tryptophan 2,3-dioxygenase